VLSTSEILRIARSWVSDRELAKVLTAICIAESGGDPRAQGDNVRDLNGRFDRFACDGWLSFGLGQIFLGVHTPMIQAMSGLDQPCQLAEWLKDPDNNFRAIAAVNANQGLSAWSVYNNGAYERYLESAEAAGVLLDQEMPQPPHDPAIVGAGGLPLPFEGIITGPDGTEYRITLQ